MWPRRHLPSVGEHASGCCLHRRLIAKRYIESLSVTVAKRVETTGVHEDPGNQHVQHHQHAGWTDREAKDHRGTNDELEQQVRRSRRVQLT